MDAIKVVLYKTYPLTNRNDFFEVHGKLEGGFSDMARTVLGVYVNAAFCGYGTSRSNEEFYLTAHLQDAGAYDVRVIPIYRDGQPYYPAASAILGTVVHGKLD